MDLHSPSGRSPGLSSRFATVLLLHVAVAPLASAESPIVAELEQVVVQAAPLGGPAVSNGGSNAYAATADDIAALPAGQAGSLTDVLAQMPGVAIDQNQQIHIRNTEGPQYQYQINGVLIPLDINTNPPFLSMLNPRFIEQLELLDGVLPARYSYATGGVVDIRTKDGCAHPGTEASLLVGSRDTVQPGVEYAGCAGALSAYVSAYYDQGNTAFSSATPGANPIHDRTKQGQLFGSFSYPIAPGAQLSLLLSGADSSNELPDVPGLAPAYALAGLATNPSSAAIHSDLDFDDYLAVLSLVGHSDALTYQLAVSEHSISQQFRPDAVGELLYQGVASSATHVDHDQTLEGDLTYALGAHELATGFYAGIYGVSANDNSLVFPVTADGNQADSTPVRIINNSHADNVVLGVYVNDRWQLLPAVSLNVGLRWDHLSGFSSGEQLDPTLNLTYRPAGDTTLHAGVARYFQVPSFLGISPTAQAAFAGTTAAGSPGIATPVPEDDLEWDTGLIQQLTERIALSLDAYYERTRHYLDTGQFGVVPIFAPFNYGHGHLWGTELALKYRLERLSAYANLTAGRNWQQGVATGQFNFNADELAYIDGHAIMLDHQPVFGASAGASYRIGAYSLGADLLYSSGLRAGFADLEKLPAVSQVNVSLERRFQIPGLGEIRNRIAVLNVFDRVNLIRPAEGIGIFQSAYGPRATFLETLTWQF